MAYRHESEKGPWTLYRREVTLNGGRAQTIYFFSRGEPRSGTPSEMPAGYAVKIVPATGLPVLKKA